MIQRWQCTHCSKKPVSDSEDNQEAKVLDKKRPSVHQPQLRIIQWNAKIIHRELPLLQDLLEANNVDVVCTQETKLQPKDRTPELRRFSAVRRDRPVQVEARWRHYDLCSKQIPGSLNGKNFVSQIQKADGFIRLHRDVSDLKFEKHEIGIVKARNSRLRSEVVDAGVCQGFTTDKVKEALRNINPTKAAGPD